ncbi:hypothetical protein ACGFNV_14745 [Streptomyces sp. NPDC048751]|uniref:hypothetical protein n=1 Tax=Streptomyces sp. NPDC048751 TaxID=3365591 RepID=UPI00372152E4
MTAALLTTCAAESGDSKSGEPAAARQFDLLVSKENGYYYPPFLREQPAAPEAQSYALRTLSELGRDPRTSMSASRVAEVRREALESSPLWGRDWLVPLRRAGAREALGPSDARAVAGLRVKGGWYADPALGGDGDAARLGATWAALDVLKALGRLAQLSATDRSETKDWLRSLADEPRPLGQSAALAGSLRLLDDEPLPAALTAVAPPSTDDWAALAPDARTDLLNDTYHYVLVQEAAGNRPSLDGTTWQAVLREGAATLTYEQLHHLVHILKASGSKGAFAPVVRRLEGERLDDGSVRDSGAYLGNPDASLFVERLRGLAGWARRDPRLVEAVDRDEKSGSASQDGAERLGRAALRRVATDEDADTDRRVCADPAVLPTTVTDRNATLWQRTALNCADAGAEIGTPEIGHWKLDTPAGVVAAATVVVGLVDAGKRDAVPRWMTAAALREQARSPERFTSVYDYALVVRAYSLIGGALDAPLREALGRGVTPYKGCPGLPDLYQVGAGDQACDLKTTWAVWALDRRLRGAMGWMPSRARGTTESAE